jgi:hypothetical protein
VNPSAELAFAAVIVVILLALAGYYGWRQWQTLRGLRHQENLTAEDRRYFRNQAWLRLVSCGLMVVLACLMAGSYLSGREEHARELAQPGATAAQKADPEQKRFANQYITYWIFSLLVLMVIVFLTVFDLVAIRRYGLRHLRKIQADRRAMLERQVALLRSQRNGHE